MPTRKRFDSMSARDTGLEYLLRRLDRLEGNPGLVARDTRRTGGTGGGVDPTFLVAASDASPGMRAAADWVCTGSGDQVEIQAAFNALPVAGGRVQLSEGTFSITSTVTVPVEAELAGVGNSTVLNINAASYGFNLGNFCTVRDLAVDMQNQTGGSRYGMYVFGDHVTIESCLFTGMRTSGQAYLTYIAMGGLHTAVDSCIFLDIGNTYGTGIEYFAGNVTGCEFVGSTAHAAIPHNAIYFYTGGNIDNGSGVVAANVFKNSGLYSDVNVTAVSITDNVFWNEGTHFAGPIIDFWQPSAINIHNNQVLTSDRDFIKISGPADSGSERISIRGNTISSGRILISAILYYSEISQNTIGQFAEINLHSTLANRVIDEVTIEGNAVGSLDSSSAGRIVITGTDQRVQHLIVRNNTVYSQDRPTSWGPDSDPLIEIQMGLDDLTASWLKSLIVEGNNLYHNRSSASILSALGISVVGRSAGVQDVVRISNNTLYGSDGISVSDMVTAHVTNNSLFRNQINPNTSGSQQITVTNTYQVVVANNMVESGDDTGTPDPAGTNSVIYVDAVSGVVHDNDVWAQNQGALDTFITYANALMEVDNRYHGLHSAQAGSVLTNGTAVGTASGSGGTASVVFTGTATGAVV